MGISCIHTSCVHVSGLNQVSQWREPQSKGKRHESHFFIKWSKGSKVLFYHVSITRLPNKNYTFFRKKVFVVPKQIEQNRTIMQFAIRENDFYLATEPENEKSMTQTSQGKLWAFVWYIGPIVENAPRIHIIQGFEKLVNWLSNS